MILAPHIMRVVSVRIPNTCPCIVCMGRATEQFPISILGQDTLLFQCDACEAAFFQNPNWLETAYSAAISSLDTGIVERCVDVANVLTPFLWSKRGLTAVDYGGGIGLLARLMRDRGYDFTSWDPISSYVLPLPKSDENHVDVITMIEVLEHLTDPVTVLRDCISRCDLVFISTHLIPEAGLTSDWYYLQPNTGQHIFFCSEITLKTIASTLGVMVTSNGANLHVFHRKPLSYFQRRVIRYQRLSWLLGHFSTIFTRDRGLADIDAKIAEQQQTA